MNELKLRPMGIGDILDSSFRLYKSNFAKFIHIMAPIYIISFIAGIIYQMAVYGFHFPKAQTPFALGVATVGMVFALIFGLLVFLLEFVALGALVYSVSGSYLGKDIVYGDAYKSVWKQFWPLIGVGVLSWIMITAGSFMFYIPGIILGIFLSLVVQVMVLEKEGVGSSISRSFELVAYCLWKAVLVCLVAYAVVFVATGIVVLPFIVWGFIRSFSGEATPQMPLGLAILHLAFNYTAKLFTSPFRMVALTLLYYDIRIRKEGFDLEVMARSLGYQTPDAQESSHPSPANQ